MLATNNLIELEPIVDDINSIIKSTMYCLDSLHRNENIDESHSNAKTQLEQLKGIFTMLNMPGSQALVEEVMGAIGRLSGKESGDEVEPLFRLISDALAILSRYVEYVSQKNASSPQLLLSTINQLRKANHLPALKESVFFVLPPNIGNGEVTPKSSDFGGSVLDFDLKNIRHLRQMFQVGLIEVIRRSNVLGGFKMMKRSLIRVDEKYSGHSLPDMWTAALCMVEGYLSGGLKVNTQRVKILSLVDRQYRLIELSDRNQSQAEDNRLVIGELLYMISLSEAKDLKTDSLKKKYQLFNNRVDDNNFKHELTVLKGPTPKDLQSLGSEIVEELLQIESLLGATTLPGEGLSSLLTMVENLASLLNAVQLGDESAKLALVISILQKATDSNSPLSVSDANIAQGVIRKLGEQFEAHDLSSFSSSNNTGRKQLNDEQKAACHVASEHITNAVKQFDLYVREHKDTLPLKNVINDLTQSKNGMRALKLNKLIKVTDGCIELIEALLSKEYLRNNLSLAALYLADAIGSVAFYLETVSKNGTPSPRVLQFANESIKELKSVAY